MRNLHIVIASVRPGRVGPAIARWFEAYAREHGGFAPKVVDIADFKLPLLDEAKHPIMKQYVQSHTKAWSASVAEADAYVFVTPEYDYFPPASFVNALQFLASEWHYKPAGLLSYGGVSGGLRAAQTEKLLITSLRMMPIPEGVPVPSYAQFIDDKGTFKPNDLIVASAKTMLDELAKWSDALKPMRAA
jgi:NAD(P)H-dependent FMN reductase